MSKSISLSISIAVLAAVWAFLTVGENAMLAGKALVWAGFIAWGAYFANGGNSCAAQKTLASMIFGAVLAVVALNLVSIDPLGLGAYAAPVYIAITVFPLVAMAGMELLSSVPTNVYGYAVTAAYALQTPNVNATQMDMANPLVIITISAVLGVIFGMISNKLCNMCCKE